MSLCFGFDKLGPIQQSLVGLQIVVVIVLHKLNDEFSHNTTGFEPSKVLSLDCTVTYFWCYPALVLLEPLQKKLSLLIITVVVLFGV